MKILEQSLTEKAIEENENRDFYTIIVDGNERISANDYGEPEDNSLNRDLNFVYSIVELMREAHEAGKRGEVFEVEKIQIELE